MLRGVERLGKIGPERIRILESRAEAQKAFGTRSPSQRYRLSITLVTPRGRWR